MAAFNTIFSQSGGYVWGHRMAWGLFNKADQLGSISVSRNGILSCHYNLVISHSRANSELPSLLSRGRQSAPAFTWQRLVLDQWSMTKSLPQVLSPSPWHECSSAFEPLVNPRHVPNFNFSQDFYFLRLIIFSRWMRCLRLIVPTAHISLDKYTAWG